MMNLAALTIVAASIVPAQPAPADRVKVYVTSVGASAGFTDPSKDNRDTVKDLRDEIRDRKSLVVAESREDAQIVLTVLGRETAGVAAGVLGGPARDRTIRVKFEAGEIQTELTASAQGGTMGS